jgi:hypothetical protein
MSICIFDILFVVIHKMSTRAKVSLAGWFCTLEDFLDEVEKRGGILARGGDQK